tara:strand:+ start:1508 stop:2251 length:744 start_codon:yes stop_codon:yes gene_type:complete
MKNFLKQIRLAKKIGFSSYLQYRLAKPGAQLKVEISRKKIFIRKGTPDLGVAISCFSGEFDIVKYLFPKDYSGIIVDAGGYIGTSAIALKQIYPKAKIIVIEPSQNNLAILKKNLEGISNIRIVYGALIGTSQKTITLKNRGTEEWGYTVVSKPLDNPNAKPLQKTPAFLLKDLLGQHEKIGLLKLDIEGGEYDLLKNDIKTLKKIPVVFAELHDRIISGCEEMYFKFSKNRILIKDRGEKYLSIKR